MTPEERLAHIGQALTAIQPGWRFLEGEIDARIAVLTEQLINNDSEQVRGRIKALREVREIPEALSFERLGLAEALAEQAASD